MRYDCVIIGGGIVGLASAFSLQNQQPGVRLLLLEKETGLALHQTGRNSGVIHSGIYYKPGSLKARLAREGGRRLVDFCREHGLPHRLCGKVILATDEQELPQLRKLLERGRENALDVSWLDPDRVREIEPHVSCVAGIAVPATGIVSYREVCARLAQLVESRGGRIVLGAPVLRLGSQDSGHVCETPKGAFESRFLLNCAGLQSDRVARMSGVEVTAQIVPFRGEYYELVPAKTSLVNTLIYPVPNPVFPFLGVHFTRMIDGSVHAGPNAVLALKREGYRRSDFNLKDCAETLAFPGFWRLASRHWREGSHEVWRSLSKRAFVRGLQRLVPEVQERDLVPSQAGVRAQALSPDGNLVEDFLIVKGRNSLHVCNAPSPAATASLAIGDAVAGELPALQTSTR